ncbi:MAG: hypothetical protein JWN37_945 [Candidatus Nomurabacteria bacterium]|nr:hypothetical protein [Candidatus Nomurabacteria bacterium]
MNWSTRRKIVYGILAIVIMVIICLYLFWGTIFPTPTCNDGKQNGYESGVDCGGLCALRCAQEVVPLKVLWSRALQTSSSSYDLVMMVTNKNIDNTPRAVGYSFVLYDESGQKAMTISGSTTAPLDSDFPIVRQNISLSRAPSQVTAEVVDGPHFKVNENPASPTIRQSNIKYEAGTIPRVYATLTNTKRIVINNLPVRVVVYDSHNNAIATGETIIPLLDKEESKQVVFTWRTPFNVVPTKISIYPILDPFLNTK